MLFVIIKRIITNIILGVHKMEIKKRGISEEFWKGYIDINCPNSGCPGYGMDGGYLGKNPIDTIYELKCQDCGTVWEYCHYPNKSAESS